MRSFTMFLLNISFKIRKRSEFAIDIIKKINKIYFTLTRSFYQMQIIFKDYKKSKKTQ